MFFFIVAAKVPCSPHPQQHLLSLVFFITAIQQMWGTMSLLFWCAFLWWLLMSSIFFIFFFLEKCLSRFSAHFQIGLFGGFFCYWGLRVLYMFWILAPYQIIWNYFILLYRLLFYCDDFILLCKIILAWCHLI